ncbi:hypothetical protein GCM10023176_22100 [Micromonospora coerulea]|uniref:Uncharacterized protein n=1 Tax=Micromonospora coerulea TaxID=47856 RepID=A0ABP8SFC6_9ACTN
MRGRGDQSSADGDGRDQGEQTVYDPARADRSDGRPTRGVTMRGHGCHRHRLLLQPTAGRLARGKIEADDPQRSVPHIREAPG